MYVHIRKSGKNKYVYIVESYRNADGKVAHRTIERVGRYDELIAKNPNFINQLKDNLKLRSHYIKQNTHSLQNSLLKATRTSAQALKDSPENKLGVPLYNYANVIIRHVLKNILRLDYCIRYLQSSTKEQSDFDAYTLLTYRILSRLFYDSPCHVDRRFYFINDTFDTEDISSNTADLVSFFQHQHQKLLNFLLNKVATQAKMPWIKETFSSFTEEVCVDDISKLVKDSNIDINLDKIISDVKSKHLANKNFLLYFESLLEKAILETIRQKLLQDGTDMSIAEIKTVMQNMLLTFFFTGNRQSPVFYLKLANKHVEKANIILKSFGFSPPSNSSLKSDITKALKIRYCQDENLLGSKIYASYVESFES